MKRADLTDKYVRETCKIGKGKKCCRFLLMGADGWDCAKAFPRNLAFRLAIEDRHDKGTMNAKGDNCKGIEA